MLGVLTAAAACGASFRAGAARLDITPRESLIMGGYAARKHGSTGVRRPLWAKAVAFDDGRGGRAVVVTMDLLRVPLSLADAVTAAARERYGLARSQVLINCAHNHSGPTLWEGSAAISSVPSGETEKSRRYTEWLTAGLVDLIGGALRDLAPATVSWGWGEAEFASNRRVRTPKGYDIGRNPEGPVDHRVPVLKIAAPDGKLRAVVFGYACHNTAIGPSSYEFDGDYAGFAQAEVERAHAGATALFLLLCGGDQDPWPRNTVADAEKHGASLAAAVEAVLSGKMRRARPAIRTAFENVDLPLAPHTREMFEKRLTDANPAAVRTARAMLKAYEEGKPLRSLSFPVQAIRLDSRLALAALGGEPVVDYALRGRREFPDVILAGYSNMVKGYVPSKRVLGEGGYEAGDSAIYYGLPGPFAPEVEDTIFAAVRRVLQKVR